VLGLADLDLTALPELMSRLRRRQGWSRGQLAKRLKTSPTVIYNMETGRSRIKLSVFFAVTRGAGLPIHNLISRHLFSIQKLTSDLPIPEIIATFRKRLQLPQRVLAERLGYSSSAIVHHFEKGRREPSLEDFLRLMQLAGDNVRGLIADLTGDQEFAERFPGGQEALQNDWQEYWAHYYVSAIRQIMRTNTYAELKRYERGYFAGILGISGGEERHALSVLQKFNLIRWENAKPVINPGTNIVVPRDISPAVLDSLKTQWLEFGKQLYQQQGGAAAAANLISVDSMPINRELFAAIVKKIRGLQDEIHNLPLRETDGFVALAWMANYVGVPKDRR